MKNITRYYVYYGHRKLTVKVFLLRHYRLGGSAIFFCSRTFRTAEIAFQIAVYVTVKGQWRIEGRQRSAATRNEESDHRGKSTVTKGKETTERISIDIEAEKHF